MQGRSQKYSAHVVGVDISQDIAVIQIDGSVSGLPTVKFADSSSLTVGETVVALGNALGRGGAPNVTSGQITALDQTITASSGGRPRIASKYRSQVAALARSPYSCSYEAGVWTCRSQRRHRAPRGSPA